jgi:hypothetical protein
MSYTEQLQRIIDKYQTAREPWPATMRAPALITPQRGNQRADGGRAADGPAQPFCERPRHFPAEICPLQAKRFQSLAAWVNICRVFGPCPVLRVGDRFR